MSDGFPRICGSVWRRHRHTLPSDSQLYTLILGWLALGVCRGLRIFLVEETVWLTLGKSQQTRFFFFSPCCGQKNCFQLIFCSSRSSQINPIHNQPSKTVEDSTEFLPIYFSQEKWKLHRVTDWLPAYIILTSISSEYMKCHLPNEVYCI